MSKKQQINILDFLITYYKYLIINEPENSKIKTLKNKLLLKRLALPIKKDIKANIKTRPSPAKNNYPTLLSTGLAYNSDINYYTKFNFSGFNIESIGQNNLKLDELIVSDISLGYKTNTNNLFLDSFDLIKIKKFKTSQVDFEDENLLSWKVQIGTKIYNQNNNKNKYNSFFSASFGKSYEITKYLASSFMIDGNIQTQYPYTNAIPNINFHFDFNKLKSSILFGYKINPYNSSKLEYMKLETQYNINKNFAISNLLEKDDIDKYSINFKWFF